MMTRLLPALVVAGALCLPHAARGDIADAIEEVLPAVVSIRAGNQAGTGFAVNRDGHIVTSAHVLGRAREVEVKFTDDRQETARVVAKDDDRDLAVLQVEEGVADWVKLAPAAETRVGEEVAALGTPLGLDHSVTKGVLSSASRTIEGKDYLQIDAALNPGNSGGPVINKGGAVIGVSTITARRAANLGFAIPSDALVAFLQQHDVEYHVMAGAVFEPPPAREVAVEPPTPLEPPAAPGLLLVIIVAAGVSIVCSALTALLVARQVIRRMPQAAPGQVVTAAPQPEDLSDIDITLQ